MSATLINCRLARAIARAVLVVAICLAFVTASATPAAALPALSAVHISTNQAIPAGTHDTPEAAHARLLQLFHDARLRTAA
jgi:hypothetical protein